MCLRHLRNDLPHSEVDYALNIVWIWKIFLYGICTKIDTEYISIMCISSQYYVWEFSLHIWDLFLAQNMVEKSFEYLQNIFHIPVRLLVLLTAWPKVTQSYSRADLSRVEPGHYSIWLKWFDFRMTQLTWQLQWRSKKTLMMPHAHLLLHHTTTTSC